MILYYFEVVSEAVAPAHLALYVVLRSIMACFSVFPWFGLSSD